MLVVYAVVLRVVVVVADIVVVVVVDVVVVVVVDLWPLFLWRQSLLPPCLRLSWS